MVTHEEDTKGVIVQAGRLLELHVCSLTGDSRKIVTSENSCLLVRSCIHIHSLVVDHSA